MEASQLHYCLSNKRQALKVILWKETKWKELFRKELCQRCFNEYVWFHSYLVRVIRYKRQYKIIVSNVNAIDARNDRIESARPEGISEAIVERYAYWNERGKG